MQTLLCGFSYQRNQEFDHWVSRCQNWCHTARKVHLFCTADFRYYTSQCRNYCHQTSCIIWCHRQDRLDRNTSALWQGYHIYKKLSNIFCLHIPFSTDFIHQTVRKLVCIKKIDLVTVFDAILTSRQTRAKLQCLYENLISNNFRKMAVLKKI